MRRIFKWIAILVAVLVLVVVALPFFINVNQFKPMLESQLSTALNREVRLGNLRLSLLAGEVTAGDLTVSEDQAFGKPAFIQAKSLSVGAEIWPFLMSRKLIVTYLTIDQPEIALVQAPSGAWNFSSLGARSGRPTAKPREAGPSMPLDLSVQLVRITNGRLLLGRTVGHWKPLRLDQVNLELRNFSATSAFPVTLSANVAGGGSLRLDGQAGPIDPADSALTPVNANIHLARLDLAATGMNDFAPQLSGLISLDGSGQSDGRTMRIQAKLTAEKLKLSAKGSPATVPLQLDVAADRDVRRHTGVIRQGDIHIGGATAHLTGSYAEQGDSVVLNLRLAGPGMPVQQLEGLLPALGVTLPAGTRLEGGTATVALDMAGPADKLVTSGTLSLDHSRLAGFDLPKKMASIERLAGIKSAPDTEIQTLHATVRVAPEGDSAQDMLLSLPAIGDVSGAGTVSPANALDFHMVAAVHTSGLAAVIDNTPIPFTVQGTCSDPQFRPDVKAVIEEKAKGLEKAAGGLLKGILGGK